MGGVVNFEGIFSFYGFLGKLKIKFWSQYLMDVCQLICYPRIDTCLLRDSVLLYFFPF